MPVADHAVSIVLEERGPLSGRRIYILEDETLVGMMIEAMLMDLGCEVIGTDTRIDHALAFVTERHRDIDLAILDLNIDGVRSYAVAEALGAKGVPFLFSTGYDETAIDGAWRGLPSLSKPFRLDELEAAMRAVLDPGRRSR